MQTLHNNNAADAQSSYAADVELNQPPQTKPGAGAYQTPLPRGLPRTIFHRRSSRSTVPQHTISSVRELAAIIPSFEVAKLLVDTYFDRIHWFMLIFFQTEFREQFIALYDEAGKASTTCDLGVLSTTLAVCAVSLQYLGEHRSGHLAAYAIDREALQARILEGLGRRFLDIIALGSIEAVHTCILLGTFYLFHGQPELAWPVCGCGLRIAQALNLHRKVEAGSVASGEVSMQFLSTVETRKRCWWAIYEVETFCCMLYGYPLTISDEDCDVEQLNPRFKDISDTSPKFPDRDPNCSSTSTVNLLHYKYFMSKLSLVIKAALSKMYRVRAGEPNPQCGKGAKRSIQPQQVNDIVKNLNFALVSWFSEYESIFNADDLTNSISQPYTDSDMDHDIGAKSFRFEYHVFQLQKLALRFAFENARILVNRPLLWHRKTKASVINRPVGCAQSINVPESTAATLCREAALRTSRLGDSTIFIHASRTYAVAFMSSHILTAGVTLCMLNSFDPLGQHAQECKAGVHQLMKMQVLLRHQSQQAEQGLEILKQLLTLIMKKESSILFDLPLDPATSLLASKSGELNVGSIPPSTQRHSQSLTNEREIPTSSEPNDPDTNCFSRSMRPSKPADVARDDVRSDQSPSQLERQETAQNLDYSSHDAMLQGQSK